MQHTPDRAAAVAAIAQMVAAAAESDRARVLALADRMLATLNGGPRVPSIVRQVMDGAYGLTPDQEREIAGLRAGGHA